MDLVDSRKPLNWWMVVRFRLQRWRRGILYMSRNWITCLCKIPVSASDLTSALSTPLTSVSLHMGHVFVSLQYPFTFASLTGSPTKRTTIRNSAYKSEHCLLPIYSYPISRISQANKSFLNPSNQSRGSGRYNLGSSTTRCHQKLHQTRTSQFMIVRLRKLTE